ncbi:MAG: peptide deformylase [Candidatus Obscuribacterales bacterium]|nr:peptide deformylase [Candidatus Obscuribacterales bacterium]
MKIVQYPHPALLRPTKPVSCVTGSLRRDIDEMFDLMYQAGGVGLAGNQVALPWRVLVMNMDHEGRDPARQEVFLNPMIVAQKGTIEDDEGCLSFPGLYAKVRRAKQVTVEAFDLTGQPIRRVVDGLEARAWQHELDHLEGKVFLDRFSELALLAHRQKIAAFEKKFRQFQQQGILPSNASIIEMLEQIEAGHDNPKS